MSVIEVEGQRFTDDELAEQALAADPDLDIADDAEPFAGYHPEFGDVLPDWYMPAPVAHTGRRRHALVASVIIASLLLVNALGLCITYGHLELPL